MIAPAASLVAIDWVGAGRAACGERWAFDSYMSRTEVRLCSAGEDPAAAAAATAAAATPGARSVPAVVEAVALRPGCADLRRAGFDVGGTDIHIHDCDVWNQDDTFCIKANHETTSNVLVENCRASGVGLSVGSIGDANVRNVTFRNVEMHHTSKGVYVKFNAKAARGGVVEDVTYENVHIEKPESWPIWIGPQQAGIKEANTTYNPCHGDPCSLCWPADKSSTCPPVVGATIRNLVLRNITISKPSGSCGVIIGDPANPINVTFDGVRFIDPKDDGAFGKDFFFAKGVNGVAMGDTYPIPPGFENRTGFQCVSGQCVPSNEGGDQASCAAVCS